jgi:hypothetical protein
MSEREQIRYSTKIPGNHRNHGWAVRFDYSDKYVGIDQYVEGGIDRVLLTPAQAQELVNFIANKGKP